MIDTKYSLEEISIHEWFHFTNTIKVKDIFLYPGWLLALRDTYHFPIKVVSLKVKSKITCAIPMMKVIDFKGKKRWVSLPFSDYCHISTQNPIARDAFLELFTQYAGVKAEYEFRDGITADGFIQSKTDYLHLISLEPELQKNEEKFSKNHRRSLKKAKRAGSEIRFRKDLGGLRDFYRLHIMTRKRMGLPVQPWRFFKNIHHHIIDAGHGFIINCYLDERCISGVMCLHWGDVLTMKFNASDNQHLSLRPNHLVYWEAIRWGIENGYKTLDLGKTDISNEGLQRFKLSWGAEEKVLIYNHLNLFGNLKNESDHDHGILRLVSHAIQAGPDFLCRGIGEVFYRFFA